MDVDQKNFENALNVAIHAALASGVSIIHMARVLILHADELLESADLGEEE